MYAQQTTWLPTTPKGLGQACPSLNQLLGCPVPDSCCNPPVGSSIDASGTQSCYNTATGATVACPVAGSVQTGAPSTNGPFGAMSFSNLNWGVLAAVLGGLVLVAAMSGGKH